MPYLSLGIYEQVGLAGDLGSTNYPTDSFDNDLDRGLLEYTLSLSRKLNGPLANQNEDGFYNRGELSRMVWVGYMAYIQDDELYDELIDDSLKDEALKQKAIYEKSWGNASQSVINFYAWSKRDGHASYSNDVQMKGEDKERCDLFDETTRDASVYKMRISAPSIPLKALSCSNLTNSYRISIVVSMLSFHVAMLETDTQETDKNKAKNDKTKRKVEKIGKDKANRSRKSKSNLRTSKSTPTKPKQKKEENIT
nr:hypothetical protein [Tanacetum cinerariifolium]